MWRVGTDLEWAGDFVFPQGFLSHWQVWIGGAAAVQYASWRLAQYAGAGAGPEADATPEDESATSERAIANV
jgi:hypothetical protein